MSRLPNSEYIRRINTTIDLLKDLSSIEEVLGQLIHQYQISRRQAYRYVEEAQKASRKLAIPEQKIAFTVKIPLSLVSRLKDLASTTGESLSSLVTHALESFLKRGRHG